MVFQPRFSPPASWSPRLGGRHAHRVTKTGTVTDILVNDYPLFSYIDDNNRLAGLDVDVARAFADKIGAKLKLETPGREAIIAGKWNGRYDLCIGSTTPSTEPRRCSTSLSSTTTRPPCWCPQGQQDRVGR